ncbi:MAG: SOS response-associated peptidase [Runella sp.]
MCFHNSLTATVAEMEKRFEATLTSENMNFEPIFHGSGFDYPLWPVITAQASGQIQLFRWGLMPRWAKSLEEAQTLRSGTLNAKIETLFEKPSFRYALQQSQRCLVPSTGFFEWHTVGKKKYPYFIRLRHHSLFAMAGLYEIWQNPQNPSDTWHTFSIITTEANPLMARIHNIKQRMPVILWPGMESLWLLPDLDEDSFRKIAEPFEEHLMEAYTVGRLVGEHKGSSNVAEVLLPKIYPELAQKQLNLW